MYTAPPVIVVIGASSLIGDFLLPALLEAGFEIRAISRRDQHHATQWAYDPNRLSWHAPAAIQADAGWLAGASAAIHLAPLDVLPPMLPALAGAGIRRLIAFGSTSLLTRQNSADGRERQWAMALADAEACIALEAKELGIDWTLFRPTLIYAPGRDRNVSTIMRFIRRFGFFPLAGQGTGLRQPVHARDLAAACLSVLDNPSTCGKAYNLSGGETLCYRDMVIRIFAYLQRPVRLVNLPVSVLRCGLALLSRLPGYRYITPEMANRMNVDLCFDAAEARRDFGFNPGDFLAS
ncbi:MAG: hypothetical protein RLZZ226_491 [Pseudomonadota bacterium]|jgi:nucleoside-diphosphate-sugar epimerase